MIAAKQNINTQRKILRRDATPCKVNADSSELMRQQSKDALTLVYFVSLGKVVRVKQASEPAS